MIQIYDKNNTDYEKNGDIVLTPSVSDITAELNGPWSVALEHPIDEEGRWKLIQEDSVLKMPSFNGEQLFRIKSKTKTDSKITATAEPIFMDAMGDCFLVDIRPTEKNGQQALDLMTAPNSKYKGKSDITQKATAYYEYKNLIEAINGGNENSFISRWGGEILFDNFTVIINKKIGQDRGVELRYGKNIPVDGMSEDVDLSAVVTRIYPKGYNGVTLSGNGYVDSPIAGSYPTIRAKVIQFDDVKMASDAQEGDEENGIIICETQAQLDAALKTKCQEQYAAGADKPAVTITADMVLLAETEQYKDYAILEEVSLGDTIRCINNVLDIDTTARVVKLTYDAIEKKVKSVVIGDAEYNYFNNVSSAISRVDSAIRPDGTVIGGQIQGFIDGALAQLRAQRSIAKKLDVRAVIIEDTDPNSPNFGALAIGTQGIEIAGKRTPNGEDWDWSTAMTFKGLIADIIVAGIIADKTGKSFWNLETGELKIEDGTIEAGTIKGGTVDGTNITGANIEGATITGSKIIADDESEPLTRVELAAGIIKAEYNRHEISLETKVSGYGVNMNVNMGYKRYFQVWMSWDGIGIAETDSSYEVSETSQQTAITVGGIHTRANNNYTEISPGHLTIVQSGKTIVSY